MLAFEIEDCEFQVGNVAIAGDICLCIEGDGADFHLTHCFVDKKPAEKWLSKRMAVWIASDLKAKGRNSRVIAAYAERAVAAQDEHAANRADARREQLRLAA